VDAAEEQERQGGVDGVGRQEPFRVVERAQRGVPFPVDGEDFAVGGGEPRPEQRRPVAPEGAGVAGLGGGVGVFVEGGEDEGLLGGGVGEQEP
jgi:hypothetical protein